MTSFARRQGIEINKTDHISIVVRDLDQARRIWEPVLGKPGRMMPTLMSRKK